MKYQIKGKSFKSDKELQEFSRDILYKGELNSCLEGEQFLFMIEYFRLLHHEWDQKEGCGVANIRRIKNIFGKTWAFQIERTDGSITDISYLISSIKKRNFEKDFKQALRWIIEPQIFAFKKAKFAESEIVTCPISNDPLRFDECHVDHFNPTFDVIVSNFVNEHRINDLSKVVAISRDNQIKAELTDPILVQEFFDYHKEVSNLRLVSPRVNLSDLKRFRTSQ